MLNTGDRVCQVCGRANPVWFAPNDLWNSVVPPDERYLVLCPICFTERAERQGLVPTGWKLSIEPSGFA